MNDVNLTTEGVIVVEKEVVTLENNYNNLVNKPKINEVELNGNLSLNQLGIANIEELEQFGISLEYIAATGVINLKNKSGEIISNVNIPLELFLKSGRYDDASKSIVLVLSNNQVITIPVASLVEGYASVEYVNTAIEQAISNSGTDGGSTGGTCTCGVETTHFNTKEIIFSNIKTQKALYMSPIIFNCETTSEVTIKIKYDVEITNSFQNSTTFILLNGVQIYNLVDNYIDGKSIEFEYSFFPSKKINVIEIKENSPISTKINNIDITLTGRNITVHSKHNKLRIHCFNNNYYIADDRVDNVKRLGFIDKDSFEINCENIDSYTEDDINEGVYSFACGPNMAKFKDVYEAEPGKELTMYVLETTTSNVRRLALLYVNDSNLLKNQFYIETSIIDYDISSGLKQYSYGKFIALSADLKPVIISLYDYTFSNTPLKLNSVELSGEFSSVSAVKNINLNYGDVKEDIRGVLVLREDSVYEFYPQENSTYKLEIAKGKNATAYYQPNSNINVYINRFNDVYVYELILNAETNQYEVSKIIKKIQGIIGAWEMYDNKLLTRKRDESYEVVDKV